MKLQHYINKLPWLTKVVCQLQKQESISTIDSLTFNGSFLNLAFTTNKDVTETISVNLSSLVDTFKPKIVVSNYSALSSVTGQELYEFVEVINSQGTPYLPGSIGGTYRAAGLYYWNGTIWVHDNDKIYQALNTTLQSINTLSTNLTQEIVDRQVAITDLLTQIQTNDTDILALQNSKRDKTSIKNSIEDDSGDLQLVNDVLSPGTTKVYGTNAAGVKGWYDQTAGGDQSFVNQSVLYKAFSDNNPNINIPTTYQTLAYKPAVAGTFDNTVFAPISNGVQILKDLENVTIMGSVFIEATNGSRVSLGMSIAINGVQSNIEGTGYIRRASGHNENLQQIIETFPTLSAGDVITISGKRNGGVSSTAQGIEDKGMLSIFGFVPSTPGVIVGFPSPIITSINTI